MKVFLDTNIIIDFYDKRGEFYYPAAIIFDLAHKNKITLYVSAVTFVNAFFLLRKSYPHKELYKSMRELSTICQITKVDSSIIRKCLKEERKDFEDGVQYESALKKKVDVVVTRNIKDFLDFATNVQTPSEFLDSFFGKDNSENIVNL